MHLKTLKRILIILAVVMVLVEAVLFLRNDSSAAVTIAVDITVIIGVIISILTIGTSKEEAVLFKHEYGGVDSKMYLAVMALCVCLLSVNYNIYYSHDEYAENVANCVNADATKFRLLPNAKTEEYLSISVRTDMINQIEQYIHNTDYSVYEYPISVDTDYKELSGMCMQLNEIAQKLNNVERDSLEEMQMVFAVTDQIEQMHFEPKRFAIGVVCLQTGLCAVIIVTIIALCYQASVNRFITENGGLEQAAKMITDSKGCEEV